MRMTGPEAELKKHIELAQALEDVGIAVNLSVPDRPSSIKRIYTDYDYDLAISNQANPSEPVPATTQYYTTDGISKGVPDSTLSLRRPSRMALASPTLTLVLATTCSASL